MKRGIIPLLKAGIYFSNKDFEYDVYSLVRAFYPRSEVQMYYSDEELSGEFDLFLWLYYEQRRIGLKVEYEGAEKFAETIFLDYEDDRKQTKNQLKQLVYRAMRSLTGKELPWGTLTGIRPTKIPMHLLEEGKKNTEIAEYMRKTYYVSNAKTALCISIANREREILKNIDYEDGYSLYVGIPFCPSLCLYCSFGSHPLKQWEGRIDTYLEALCKELDFISQEFQDKKLNTIYIGGGTPTTLSAQQLERLLTHIGNQFSYDDLKEFTIEAGRPDSISKEKLEAIKRYPVSRISVNPQTMNQETLDIIGRKHTVEEVEHTFHLARETGFDNINMDLIIGLPGEDEAKVAHTLARIKELAPDSLTVHSLSLKRATRLNLFKEQYEEISFENSQTIMDMAAGCAYDMGMGYYYLYRQKNIAGNFENVGYAKVDKAGIYNILIMEEKQSILAAGAGASTKYVFENGQRIERIENVKDVTNYIARIDEMIERKRIGKEKWLR